MTTAPLRKATSRDEDEILALLDALRQAHHDKDAAAIAAAYADDAIICDLAPPLFHRGVDVKEAGMARQLGRTRHRLHARLPAHVGNAEGRRPTGELLAARHDLRQSRERGVEDRPSALVGAVLHGRQPAAGVRSAAVKTASMR
jgi:ethanolamine ammonia-lyase small subunit